MPPPRSHPDEFGHVALRPSALRGHVGPFLQIVAFTPMSFMPLSDRCLELVGEQLRENVASSKAGHHFLECFLDRPNDPIAKVSLQKLAACIYHVECTVSLTPRLDADAIFALLALRRFNLSEEVERLDANFYMTPLHVAISVHASCPAIMDLLLAFKAAVTGYQFQRFDEDGLVYERETLLARAVRLNRPAAVETLLLARADPNALGYEKNAYSEADRIDDGHESDGLSLLEDDYSHHIARTPLWTAVDRACNVEPHGECNVRSIVNLLIMYRARPDQLGNKEFHRILEESGGYQEIHMNDSDTTPEEIARRACEDVPRDLLELLRSYGSCRVARKRPREAESSVLRPSLCGADRA